MTLYPEVQKKAQSELDNLFNGRLPEFIDGNAAEVLPYTGPILHFLQLFFNIADDSRCSDQGNVALEVGHATGYVLKC
jgi:hypothetical protein